MKNLNSNEFSAVCGGTVHIDTVYTLTGDSCKRVFTGGMLLTMTKDGCSVNGEDNSDVFSFKGFSLNDTQSIHGVHIGGSTVYKLHDEEK